MTYRICSACVMDTTADPDIEFDDAGVCGYWREAEPRLRALERSPEASQQALETLFATFRGSGKGQYDCVLGLSGGVDSSYLAWLCAEYGLKPLVVHFDNGWNSETAVANIQRIVEKLDFDLMTYVIDWREFRDVQRAYFQADVIDIEAITDHAIFGALLRLAKSEGIRVILDGRNTATESLLPPSWTWNKQDLRNLRDIHRRFGQVPLDTFPTMSNVQRMFERRVIRRVSFVAPLDLANFSRTHAVETLRREFGWSDYGRKHGESVFTRFYQEYILPVKFGVDKRRVHYSSLIMNRELTRGDALALLEQPAWGDRDIAEERNYVCKKLGFSADELEAYLRRPPVAHDHYRTDKQLRRLMTATDKLLKRLTP